MASSSSFYPENMEYRAFTGIEPQPKRIKYSSAKLFDVFINHRGPDVKATLALQLYNSLQKMGCRTFLDSEEIELGDFIFPTLDDAISSASVQISIFSPGYAESKWCLEELVLMLQQTKAIFIPVFYKVQPCELRYTEKGVYADAFAEYVVKQRNPDRLEVWKKALASASFFKGYEFGKQNGDQEKLFKDLVIEVLKAVQKIKPLAVAKSPVGHNALVEDFRRHCLEEGEKDKIIGIFGMGGSGKTTLAKELFNRKRSEYSGSCFLFDVREAYVKNELSSLQLKLLRDLIHEDHPGFQNTDEGSSYLACRLRYRPKRGGCLNFLIVLDDIDNVDQLNTLIPPDSLNNSCSLVIVTTRDERVLIRAGISLRYKMKGMNPNHSRELFCRHAFRKPYPTPGYEDLVESFVETCGGLPLSLRVLGGHVFGSTDKLYWQLQLDKILKILPDDVKQRLRISFDALDCEEKQILMDIACFFIGREKRMAIRIWEASGWSAEHGLQTLKDKRLVEEESLSRPDGRVLEDKIALRMHDHIRDLGREMADQLTSPRRPWRPQNFKSLDMNRLKNILNQTSRHSFRFLHCMEDPSFGSQFTYFIRNAGETSPAWLWLDVEGTIPLHTPLQNLQYLRIFKGSSWDDLQVPLQLKELRLIGTESGNHCANSGYLSHLEDLVIEDCQGILGQSFHKSLGKLGNLKSLALRHLTLPGELASRHFTLPGEIALKNTKNTKFLALQSSMKNLEKIELVDVKLLQKFSISLEYCPSLLSLHLENMENLIQVDLTGEMTQGIPELESFINSNTKGCYRVTERPSLPRLSPVKRITLNGCWKLKNMKGVQKLNELKYLHLLAKNGAIRGCINNLKIVPSEAMYLIGKAFNGAESTLNPNLFSGMIEGAAVSESFRQPMESLNRPQCAIIQCIVFESPCKWQIDTRFAPYIESNIPAGKWIATTVIGSDAEILALPEEIAKGCLITDAKVRKVCTATLNKGEECKILPVVKRIIDKLHSIF